MTIGELILQYCKEHSMSQLKFAERSKVSKGYITMLVKGRNPKTGKPIRPTIETYNDIAAAMSMTLDELFDKIEDAPVLLSSRKEEDNLSQPDDDDVWAAREALRDDPYRKSLVRLARHGSAEDVRQVAAIIDALRATNPEFWSDDD